MAAAKLWPCAGNENAALPTRLSTRPRGDITCYRPEAMWTLVDAKARHGHRNATRQGFAHARVGAGRIAGGAVDVGGNGSKVCALRQATGEAGEAQVGGGNPHSGVVALVGSMFLLCASKPAPAMPIKLGKRQRRSRSGCGRRNRHPCPKPSGGERVRVLDMGQTRMSILRVGRFVAGC